MKPFQKILVPVDFSPHSAEAIEYAADLSQRYGASLTLAHVFQPVGESLPDGAVLYGPPLLTGELPDHEKQIEDAREDAQRAGAARVDVQMLQGSVETQILEFAREGAFDLIVMGTHGRKGLEHVLMGSVAEKVVRKAPCPVLTVRRR